MFDIMLFLHLPSFGDQTCPFFALQQDTNKYLSHLTQIISDTTKSPQKGVPKPIPSSRHPNEDINMWPEYFNAISSLNKWSQDDCANLLHIFLEGPPLCYFQKTYITNHLSHPIILG